VVRQADSVSNLQRPLDAAEAWSTCALQKATRDMGCSGVSALRIPSVAAIAKAASAPSGNQAQSGTCAQSLHPRHVPVKAPRTGYSIGFHSATLFGIAPTNARLA
jgi:hypothetical protein